MTAYRQRRKDILKFRFQLLILKFISHRHGRHSISAISKPIYITRRLHHRVCGRTSFVIRADFSAIAPAPRPETEGKGDGKRRRLHLHGRVACCTGRDGWCSARLRPSVRPFVRPVIIGELLLFYGRPHALSQRASFTYRDSPRMRRRRRTWMPQERGTPGRKERAACWPARVIDRERKKIRCRGEGGRERKKNCREWMHGGLRTPAKTFSGYSRDFSSRIALTFSVVWRLKEEYRSYI